MCFADDPNSLPVSEDVRKCPNSEFFQTVEAIDERKQRAIELLVGGASFARVCEVIRVDPRTLYRWRHDPQFQMYLSRYVDMVWQDSANRLRTLAGAAMEALARGLSSDSPSTSLRAALFVLKWSGMENALNPSSTKPAGKSSVRSGSTPNP